MKISYNWLKEHVDVALPPEEVADILTRTGLEVDEHHPTGVDSDKLEGLLVGKVEAVNPHPNADKLVLTSVDVGEKELLPIVCGAPNVEAGQKVIVAPPGTQVHPVEGEPFKIKKAKIRGEVSHGMICSAAEIGASDDHDGIMVLHPETEVGRSVGELFRGTADHLFEIDLPLQKSPRSRLKWKMKRRAHDIAGSVFRALRSLLLLDGCRISSRASGPFRSIMWWM